MSDGRQTSRTLLAVTVAAVFTVALLVFLGFTLLPKSSTSTDASSRPVPTGAIPSPTAAPSLPPSVIPASCEDIYTRDWATELKPLVLNPAWSQVDPGVAVTDVALTQLLEPNTQLTCQWGKSTGGSDVGMVTNLATVDEHTIALAKSRIATLGWACSDQWNGVRCVTEGSDANGSWGESDFFRDGVWIATRWTNSGPDGYTADIVHTLWP